MTGGQIAEYKADSAAAQEDGTVDYIFHVAMTDAMFYRVSGASYVTYNGTTVDGSDERIVVSADMLNLSGNTKTTLDRNPDVSKRQIQNTGGSSHTRYFHTVSDRRTEDRRTDAPCPGRRRGSNL